MAIQIACALMAVISAMNLFILMDILKRIGRIEQALFNIGLRKNSHVS